MKTEKVTKVFSGKGIAMMHECKRMLNHSTSDQGLLCASRAAGRTEATAMHTFLVPQPPHEDTDSDASSDATEHSSQDSEPNTDGNATERATKKRRSDEATKDPVPPGAATEHTDYLEDCGDEAFPQVITATGLILR